MAQTQTTPHFGKWRIRLAGAIALATPVAGLGVALAPSSASAQDGDFTAQGNYATTTLAGGSYEGSCEDLDQLLKDNNHNVRIEAVDGGDLYWIDQAAYDFLIQTLTTDADPIQRLTPEQAHAYAKGCGFCVEVPHITTTTTTEPPTTEPPTTEPPTTEPPTTEPPTTEPPTTMPPTTMPPTTEPPTTEPPTTTTLPEDNCPDLSEFTEGRDMNDWEDYWNALYDFSQSPEGKDLTQEEIIKIFEKCDYCQPEQPHVTTTMPPTTEPPTTEPPTTEPPTTEPPTTEPPTTEPPTTEPPTTEPPTTEAPTPTAPAPEPTAPAPEPTAPAPTTPVTRTQGTPQLAWTGADVLALAGTGAATLAAGGGLVVAGRRSRKSDSPEVDEVVAAGEPPVGFTAQEEAELEELLYADRLSPREEAELEELFNAPAFGVAPETVAVPQTVVAPQTNTPAAQPQFVTTGKFELTDIEAQTLAAGLLGLPQDQISTVKRYELPQPYVAPAPLPEFDPSTVAPVQRAYHANREANGVHVKDRIRSFGEAFLDKAYEVRQSLSRRFNSIGR